MSEFGMAIICALLLGLLVASIVGTWLVGRPTTKRAGRIGKRPYPRQTMADVSPFTRARR